MFSMTQGDDLYKLLQIETNDDKQEFALDIRHSAVQVKIFV
jgi:hypothetical protein